MIDTFDNTSTIPKKIRIENKKFNLLRKLYKIQEKNGQCQGTQEDQRTFINLQLSFFYKNATKKSSLNFMNLL